MAALVLTPFTRSRAVELGNRAWRKKVLPVGDVEYKGRTLHFTRDYLGKLVQAFNDRAYDQVPFQLATDDNAHTNNPERTRGEVTGMELGDDGLYVTARLTPEGEKVLAANPKLGVSARIVESYQRSDGKFFGQAVQHVLGTLDPRIPGLGPWTAVEMSEASLDMVIDLSGESFAGKPPKARKPEKKPAGEPAGDSPPAGSGPAGDGTDPEGNGMPGPGNLSPEQQAKLARLLAVPDDQLDALAAGGVILTPDEITALTSDGDDGDAEDGLAGEIAGLSDEELAALQAEFEADARPGTEPGFTPGYMPDGEPVAAGLTAEAQFAIDLARAQGEETARELAVVTARLRESDFLAEKDRLFRDFGIPPYVADLARPLLEGAGHVVEMANGRSADAGQVVRKVMTEMASLGGLRDLSGAELGSPMDEPEGTAREQQEADRGDLMNRFKNATGLR